MLHPLASRVEKVQRTAQRLRWLHGVARLTVVSIALLAACGGIDYLFRAADPAARWLLSVVAVTLFAGALVKLILPSFLIREGLVTVAQRIEQRFGQLNRQLSSAVAFLVESPEKPTTGSLALRQAVVGETEALARQLDFDSVLERREAIRLAVWAAIAVAVAALGVVAAPTHAGLAALRLALPWRELPWPRRHELVLISPPERLAVGEDFELAVVDRHSSLPESVQVLIRDAAAAGTHTEEREMKLLNGRMIYRRENITRSFEYRVRGGDDDTIPWQRLTVVEPPKLLELTVHVAPPAYASMPPRSESRVVKALVGSHLQIRGRFDKPIKHASVWTETPEFSLPPVAVSPDGLNFTAPAAGGEWVVDRSGSLWCEFADRQGLHFGRETHIEVQAVPDAPPSIAWESPVEPLYVTAGARVPIRGIVKDDLAVQGIQLRYTLPGHVAAEQVMELFSLDSPQSQPAGDIRPFDDRWDLSRLPDLVPGAELSLRILAEDAQPQVVSTAARRVIIISGDALLRRVASRQAAILEQLAESLRLERQVRDRVQWLTSRSAEMPLNVDLLHALEALTQHQREVQQLLGNQPAGAERLLRDALRELADNRADQQAIAQKLAELLTEVQRVNERPLPVTEQQLTEAVKTAREMLDVVSSATDHKNSVSAAMLQSVRAADLELESIVQALARLVGALTEWDDANRVSRELGQIAMDQEVLADETEELRLKSVIADAALPGDQQARVQQLAQRQGELARRLDKLQARLDKLSTAEAGHANERFLASAQDSVRRLAIGGQMRAAAGQLARRQLGAARDTEGQVLKSLQQLRDALGPDQAGADASAAPGTGQQPMPHDTGANDADADVTAQLEQLKRLQEELNVRTTELDAAPPPDSNAASREQAKLALARDQSRLADAVQELLSRLATQPERMEKK